MPASSPLGFQWKYKATSPQTTAILDLQTSWVMGEPAAFDLSFTSPLNSSILQEADVTAGAAALFTER